LLSLLLESIDDPQNCVVDIDGLARKLADSILAREYLETRHNTVEDEGLIGLLNLMSNVMKHDPPFKTSREGQDFLAQVCIPVVCIIILRNYVNLKPSLNILKFPN
jgi:ubiquitin carboxyl-terminal hydrolase 34